MSLLKRASSDVRVDPAVRKVLEAYGQAPPEARAEAMRRAMVRLTAPQQHQLIARLAEVALGQLWVLHAADDPD